MLGIFPRTIVGANGTRRGFKRYIFMFVLFFFVLPRIAEQLSTNPLVQQLFNPSNKNNSNIFGQNNNFIQGFLFNNLPLVAMFSFAFFGSVISVEFIYFVFALTRTIKNQWFGVKFEKEKEIEEPLNLFVLPCEKMLA